MIYFCNAFLEKQISPPQAENFEDLRWICTSEMYFRKGNQASSKSKYSKFSPAASLFPPLGGGEIDFFPSRGPECGGEITSFFPPRGPDFGGEIIFGFLFPPTVGGGETPLERES